jgi:hypothetical protein
MTAKCIGILEADNKRLYKEKSIILEKITRVEYDEILESWALKLQRCKDSEQSYGFFLARK